MHMLWNSVHIRRCCCFLQVPCQFLLVPPVYSCLCRMVAGLPRCTMPLLLAAVTWWRCFGPLRELHLMQVCFSLLLVAYVQQSLC